MAASRRAWALSVLCLLLALALPLPARADTGPKPSVKIEFTGSAGQPYYATLLSRESSTGPQSAYDPEYPESAQYPRGKRTFGRPLWTMRTRTGLLPPVVLGVHPDGPAGLELPPAPGVQGPGVLPRDRGIPGQRDL